MTYILTVNPTHNHAEISPQFADTVNDLADLAHCELGRIVGYSA